MQLRDHIGADACPVFSKTFHSLEYQEANKDDVVQIVINALPLPDESVSWEQILEYRSDPESESKFLALRNWMAEIGKAKFTAIEVEEKLEYLINQYQQHMKLHKIKTNTGTLETILTIGLGLLENIVKLNLERVAKGLFTLKHRKIELIEGELKVPGNEIAYIVKARETFP